MIHHHFLRHLRWQATHVLDWHYWNLRLHGLFHMPSRAAAAEMNQRLIPYYFWSGVAYLSISWLLLHFWPQLLPFGFWRVWEMHGTLLDWLKVGSPMLIWGFVVTFTQSVLTRNSKEENRRAEEILKWGLFTSSRAGSLEELCFRWAHFLFFSMSLQLADYVFGGFIFGHGLFYLAQMYFLSPVANFFTLHLLQDWLMNDQFWYVAAGLIAANSHFRDGHKYLGLFGVLNSWFGGMFFFYMTLNYGILSAIIIHAAYDTMIDLIRYWDECKERREGNV